MKDRGRVEIRFGYCGFCNQCFRIKIKRRDKVNVKLVVIAAERNQ